MLFHLFCIYYVVPFVKNCKVYLNLFNNIIINDIKYVCIERIIAQTPNKTSIQTNYCMGHSTIEKNVNPNIITNREFV